MKQINFGNCKLWQRAMSYVVTGATEDPAVPEITAPTTLHGVTTHQPATQIFTAEHASNTTHEPTQNSPDNFHGKILYPRGSADFPKIYPKSHLKILSVGRVTSSKFHAKDPQMLGVTVQDLVARTTWRPIFVHACPKQYKNPVEIFLNNFKNETCRRTDRRPHLCH